MATVKVESQIVLTRSQKEAAKLASQIGPRFILYRGGSRSGKSYLISYIVLMRAWTTPGSRHGIFRKTQASCRQTLFDLTFRQVMEATYPGLFAQCLVSESEATITLPNGPDPRRPHEGGSTILFLGLDDGRRDKILGNEFATIWINECNEVDWEHVQLLRTRLNQKLNTVVKDELGQPIPLRAKMFLDCNPRWESDWDCQVFKYHRDPETGGELPRKWQWVMAKLDPEGNRANIEAEYFEDMMTSTGKRRARFVLGEWSVVNENALFTAEMWEGSRRDIEKNDLKRIVIAVDPAVTNHKTSDQTGIIVAGIDWQDHLYVLHDASGRYTPAGWADKVAALYEEWEADRIVCEVNQGGDLVATNLRHAHAFLPISMVRAFKGKALRAEPVAGVYERSPAIIHHATRGLDELEAQMERFDSPQFKGSPDRVDALVYAITELARLRDRSGPPGGRVVRSGRR